MHLSKRFRSYKSNPYVLAAALMLGMMLAVGGSVFATTVGNSISVSNILTVAGGSASAPSLSFSSDADSGVFSVSGDVLGFATGGSQRAQFTNSGALGIGTTTPGGFLALTSATSSPGVLFAYTGTGPALYIEDAANDATPLVVDANGNLGIGTSTPASVLSVRGDGNNSGLWFNGYLGVATSTPGGMLAVATSTQSTQTAFLVSNLGTGFTAWFEDAANDTSPVTIDAAGNLGVGTTSPGTLFSVDGVANFNTGTSTVATGLRVQGAVAVTSATATTTVSTGGFQVGQAGALAAFTVNQSATTSVGVGTSTPTSHQFAVGGNVLIGAGANGTSTLAISSSGTNVGSCIQLRAADGNLVRIYATSSPTAVYTNNGGALPGQMLVVEAGSCR